MVFVKESLNPTHTYVDLFIRFFLLNNEQGGAGLVERGHRNYSGREQSMTIDIN